MQDRNADLYKKNVKLLEIDPEEIPRLFISHEHGDHTAGIPWITRNQSIGEMLSCRPPMQRSSGPREKLPPNSTGLSKPTHLYGPFLLHRG